MSEMAKSRSVSWHDSVGSQAPSLLLSALALPVPGVKKATKRAMTAERLAIVAGWRRPDHYYLTVFSRASNAPLMKVTASAEAEARANATYLVSRRASQQPAPVLHDDEG